MKEKPTTVFDLVDKERHPLAKGLVKAWVFNNEQQAIEVKMDDIVKYINS